MATLKKFRCQKGISLLEVMVALAIASIALVSFISLVLTSLNMEEHARKLTEATLIADEKLREVERGDFPAVKTTEGPVDENTPSGFNYKLRVTETPIENVRQIDIEVSWDNKRRSVDLTTFVAKKE
jgi:general secretion pathway protein I